MKVLHKVRVEVGVLLKEAVQIQKVYAIALYNFFTFDLIMLYKFQNSVYFPSHYRRPSLYE
jgi:predicted amidophosphoribosyltransferase